MSKLLELVSNITSHPAVNNSFFDKWQQQKFSYEGLLVLARNFWMWTYSFPAVVANLVANTNDYVARTEYSKTLYSEMGYGNAEKVHAKLFEGFCEKLLCKLGNEGSVTMKSIIESIPCLKETHDLVNWELDIYATDKFYAAGAQLALEWQAYTMIMKFYEGARLYQDLWQGQLEFHEACEFFYAHLGEVEKEHREEALRGAESLVKTDDDFIKIRAGYEKHLSLIQNFWCAIAKEVHQ